MSTDETPVPSFMQNPAWADLEEEIAAGKKAERNEAQARLDDLREQISNAESKEGVSALGTEAPKEDLYVLRRRFHRAEPLAWLVEKPLTSGELNEFINLWSKLGAQPALDKSAFISLAEAEEMERKRQAGQIETIRQLMQSPKISFGPTTELPETSSLGSELADDEHAYILNKWFFEENPGYRQYFYGMVFSEEEKTRLVWLYDEVKPGSFSSVAQLKQALSRRFAGGRSASGSTGTIGERLEADSRFQGHPDRHNAPTPKEKSKERSPKGEKRERKPRPKPPIVDEEIDDGDGENSTVAKDGPAVECVHAEGNGSSKLGEVIDFTEATNAVASGSRRKK